MRRLARTSLVVLATSLAVTMTATAAGRIVGLPNPRLTPGATNPRVTQGSLHTTICVVGYTKSIRPSESYTEALKFRQLDSGYNLRGNTRASNYEEDHLIPLEVGGSPSSVSNLWPQPRYVTWSASKKDALENTLHRLVCEGAVSLASAQNVFRSNWIAGYKRYEHS